MRFLIERVELERFEPKETGTQTLMIREEGDNAVEALKRVLDKEGSEIVGDILELPGLGAMLTAKVGSRYVTLSCYPETGPLPIPRSPKTDPE